MDKQSLAVALVRRVESDGIRWLLMDQPQTGYLKFVVVERIENESLKEAVGREVAWQWDLDRNRDFIVSNMAQLNVDLIEDVPGQSDPVQLLVSFCSVEVYRSQTIAKLEQDPRARWLNSQSIWNGKTDDGQIIDPFFVMLNQRFRVIQAWDSDQIGWTSDPPIQ